MIKEEEEDDKSHGDLIPLCSFVLGSEQFVGGLPAD